MEGANIQGNLKRMRSDDGERKTPRKIFGPIKGNYVWRIRTYHDLTDLQRESDIFSEIRKARLRWLGHVERMPEERNAKSVQEYPRRKKVSFKDKKLVVEHCRK
jgi:hypothetical protein